MKANWNIEGKTVLITGATNGIGKVTALTLAKRGAKVVLVGRDSKKTQEVFSEIKAACPAFAAGYLIADLSIQENVHRLADEFLRGYDRLDVLINNAGAIFMTQQESTEGLEMTFALNHMGYFTLTQRLLPLLKTSAPVRIINVSSAAHITGRLNFDDLQNEKSYSGWKVYSQSKLANLYFTYELARRLEGTSVTVNALHPGFVATNFGKSNRGIFMPLFSLAQIMAISPEKGAETLIFLASSPDVEGITGKYFSDKKIISSSSVSYNKEYAERLWQISEELAKTAVNP